VTSVPARADDWPQWRGPERTGVSREMGLLKEWPADGPKLLWKATGMGGGYSTPAVVGDRIYLLGSRDNDEFAMALDVKDGRQVWSTRIGGVGPNRGQQYPGARSTPTVDGDLLYALSSDGDLACLETGQGTVRWVKSLRGPEFQGTPGNWAYAESPLIDGDVLVCTPGGKKATLAALNKKTGDVIWTSAVPGGDEAAYASIVIGRVGGIRQYIQLLGKGLVGVDAATGRFLWRYDKTVGGSPANIPTPVFHDGLVFTSTGRGGGGAAKLTADNTNVSAEQIYHDKTLSNNIGGMVRVGDHLYGTNRATLLCVEFATGKVKWQERSVGQGAVCYADGHLYLRSEDGPVALVEATPAGYKEQGRFKQPDRSDKPAWPHPVVANGRLYLRDVDVLLCYDVKDPKGGKP
jgi:outer membrane protein assembly factor BamB